VVVVPTRVGVNRDHPSWDLSNPDVGGKTIGDGLGTVKELVGKSNGRVVILAGSGITMQNEREISLQTSVTEIHVKNAVSVARPAGQREAALYGLAAAVVDASAVRRLLETIH